MSLAAGGGVIFDEAVPEFDGGGEKDGGQYDGHE